MESELIDESSVLYFPGVPWNLDVVLISTMYLVIGFCFSTVAYNILSATNWKTDVMAVFIFFILICFVYIDFWGMNDVFYVLDMKHIKYDNYLLNILVPSMFFMFLLRLSVWISRLTRMLKKILVLIGRITIPIMFMHVPLNELFASYDYSWPVYVLIGIIVPMALCFCVGRNDRLCKIIGIKKCFWMEY